jgi:hypothetical protein
MWAVKAYPQFTTSHVFKVLEQSGCGRCLNAQLQCPCELSNIKYNGARADKNTMLTDQATLTC